MAKGSGQSSRDPTSIGDWSNDWSSSQTPSDRLHSVQSSMLQSRLTDSRKKCSPVLGMRYLSEFHTTSGVVVAFTCSLCYASIAESDIIPHITSHQHRYNFYKKERPDLRVKIDELGKQSEKEGMVKMLAAQAPPTDGNVNIVSFTSTSVQNMLRQLSFRIMTLKTHMPVGSLISTLKESNTDREISTFQRNVKTPSPLLGLRFLLEVTSKVPGAGSLTKSIYICSCCDQTLPMENIMTHVASFHHIANYFYLCHQEILTILCGADLTDDEFRNRCVECGKGIESKEGWDQVLCVTRDEFMLLCSNRDTDVLKITGKVTEMTVSELQAKMSSDLSDASVADDTKMLIDDTPEEMSPPTRRDNRPVREVNTNRAIVADAKEQRITPMEGARLTRATNTRHPPKDQKWVMDSNHNSVLSCFIKENKITTPILTGLDYITEYRCSGEKVKYRCELCHLRSNQIRGARVCITHITGYRHRMAYLARKHRQWFDELNHMEDIVDMREKCEIYSKAMVKKYGSGTLIIVYDDDWEEEKEGQASHDTQGNDDSGKGSLLGKRSHDDDVVEKCLADLQFYKLLKGNEILVGLNYLTEIHKSATDNTVLKYTCTLCNYSCSKTYIITHMQGLVHRDKFLEKNYPMLHKKTQNHKGKVHHFVRDIQSQFGREPINLSWQTATDSKGEPAFSTPISTRAFFNEEGIPPNQKKSKLTTPTKANSTTTNRAGVFDKLAALQKNAVLIGLQHVTEVRHPTNDQLVCFECNLCNLRGMHTVLTIKNIVRHICTKGHRMRFFKETHEHIYEDIMSNKDLNVRDNMIQKHSRDLEASVGNGQVVERVESETFWSRRQAKQTRLQAAADSSLIGEIAEPYSEPTEDQSDEPSEIHSELTGKQSGQTRMQSRQAMTQAHLDMATETEEDATKSDDGPVRVFVCHVDSPSMFNVQYVSEQQKLGKLSLEIQKFCRGMQCEPVSKLTGGEKVLARSVQDGRWYRAFVKNVDSIHPETKIKVRYVDVGHEEELSSDRLKRTTGVFARDPYYAKRCCLANIVPRNKDKGWLSEAVQVFSTLVKNKEMDMVIVSKQSTPLPHLVELYKCDSGKTRVHDILITQRHGELGVPTQQLMFSDAEPNKTKPFLSQKVRQILAQRKTSVESWRRASSNLERKIETGEVRLSFRPSKFKATYAWLDKEHQVFAGLELLTEVQHEDERVEPWYLCRLCEERIDCKNICSHIQSPKHKILYIEKRDIEMFWIVNRTEVLSPLVDKMVKELHTKVGGLPQNPSVWLQRDNRGLRVQDVRSRSPSKTTSPEKAKARKESTEDRERIKRAKRSHSKSDRDSDQSYKRSRSPSTVKGGPSKWPRTDKPYSDVPKAKTDSGKSRIVNTPAKKYDRIIDLTEKSDTEVDEDLEGSMDDSFDGMSEFDELEAIDELGASSDEENNGDCVVTAGHIAVKSEPGSAAGTGEEKAAKPEKSESIGINDVMTYVSKSCYGVGAKRKIKEGGIIKVDDDVEVKKAGRNLPEKKKKEEAVVVSVDIGGSSIDSKVEKDKAVGLELTSRSGTENVVKAGSKEVKKAVESSTKVKKQEKVVVSVDIGDKNKDKEEKVKTGGLELTSAPGKDNAGKVKDNVVSKKEVGKTAEILAKMKKAVVVCVDIGKSIGKIEKEKTVGLQLTSASGTINVDKVKDKVEGKKEVGKAGESLAKLKNQEKAVVVSVDIDQSKGKVNKDKTVGLEFPSASGTKNVGKVKDNIEDKKGKVGDGLAKMKTPEKAVVVSVDIGKSKDKAEKDKPAGVELTSGIDKCGAVKKEADSDMEDQSSMDGDFFEWDVVDEVGEDEEVPEVNTAAIKQEAQPVSKEAKPSHTKETKSAGGQLKASQIKTEVVVDVGPSSSKVAAPGTGSSRRAGEVNVSVDTITKKNEQQGAKNKPTSSTGGQRGIKSTSSTGIGQLGLKIGLKSTPSTGQFGIKSSPRPDVGQFGIKSSPMPGNVQQGRKSATGPGNSKQRTNVSSNTNKSGRKSGSNSSPNTSNIKSEKKKEKETCEITIVIE